MRRSGILRDFVRRRPERRGRVNRVIENAAQLVSELVIVDYIALINTRDRELIADYEASYIRFGHRVRIGKSRYHIYN